MKTLCTPENMDYIEKSVSLGMTNKDALAIAGIDESTFYKWGKRAEKGDEPYFQFFQRIKRARIKGKRSRIERIVNDSSWQSDAWWLERIYPEEFGKKERLDLTTGGEPLNIKLNWGDRENT